MRYFIIFFISIIFDISISHSDNNIIKILSTTSTRDSGFFNYILPKFEKQFNANVYVIATGTGQAIKNAINCNGDILITHATDLEEQFVKDGFGDSRHDLMYNDFIIIGPKNKNISDSNNILDVFKNIAKSELKFISRGDNSGTDISEKKLWELADINITNHSGSWYLETGQGMGPSLNIAIATNSFIYTDRATWLKFQNKQEHEIKFSGDERMFNQYGIVKINPDHCDNLNLMYSNLFFNWITSKHGQSLINNYKYNGHPLFFPNHNDIE